ncbi:MAG: bifunctional precorrin-2 dehydrogenase/sirohydrochlorin ferrochelatase [bacterium]
MMSGLPVHLKLKGRLAVIAGGGEVALRKARNFLDAGALVKVICPVASPGLHQLAEQGKVELVERAYQKGDLSGAFICAACADDPEVNQAVGDHARELGVPANIADDPEGSDYQVPSYFRQGPLVLSLSTSGASPAVARTLRRMIQSYLGENMGRAIERINRFREDTVKKDIERPADRVRFWEEALTPEILELARQGKTNQIEARLLDSLQRFKENQGKDS